MALHKFCFIAFINCFLYFSDTSLLVYSNPTEFECCVLKLCWICVLSLIVWGYFLHMRSYQIIQSVNSDCSTSFFTISYTLSFFFLSWLPCLGFSVLCWIQVVKVGILACVNLNKLLAFSLLNMLAAALPWSLLCWGLSTLYIGLEFLSWRDIAFYKIPFLHLLLYSVLISLLMFYYLCVCVCLCLSVGVCACVSTEIWKPENNLDCCSSGVLPATVCLFVFVLIQGFSLCSNLPNALD